MSVNLNMKLDVFFDYACPYCLKGYRLLKEILNDYPNIKVIWRPCEAHPRPDKYGLHSDLCARGMLFAEAHNADLLEYHNRMFNAIVKNRNIEDIHVVADLVYGILDRDQFYMSLQKGDYKNQLNENNWQAWEVNRFAAVPSLCMNGKQLRAVEDVGLSKQMIIEFLEPFKSE